jgi:hydrogenase/urease accessory protein HupE
MMATARARVMGIAAAALLCAAAAHAHEIGKTQATATFRADGTYQIDVVVDPDALLTKLEIAAGTPATPSAAGLDRAERDRRIASLAGLFLDRVTVRFDDAIVRPSFEYRPASAFSDMASAPSIVRLSGATPHGAQSFSLLYGLAMGSYALNVRLGDSAPQKFWLEGTQASGAISLTAAPPPATGREVARQYFVLGFTHILPNGLDHILFVVGIFLLTTKWRSVLLQVSTFTIAHSITLGLTMYGLVSLPARVVEPMIAVSIAYVAIENILTAELKPSRLALVFGFGLLHGMGFAGVLRDLGLPRSQFLTALLTFNVGVEAGQLAVIVIAFAAVAYWRRNQFTYRRFIVQPASFAIALAGLYWTVQRVL